MEKISRRALRCEILEERVLPAVIAGGLSALNAEPSATEGTVWMVNTTADPSSWNTADQIVSLREAINRAAAGDTITFDRSLAGKTISLAGTQLEIFRGITIDASATGGINIDAAGKSSVFYVSGGNASLPVVLAGLTISGGKAYNGGGVCNYGTLVLTDCTVSGNGANYGGGISNSGGKLTLTDVTLTGNSADDHGGAVYNSGTITLTRCGLFGNSANTGGGFYNKSGAVTLTNCALCENNAAYNGGGIYHQSGTLTLTNCTVAGNSAGDYYSGGGIYNSGRSVTLYNSLIVQNRAGSGSDIRRSSGSFFAYYSLSSFTDWTEAARCLVEDPNVPLFSDPENGDYTLVEEAQAVDCGSNTYAEGIPTDLAGNARIADGFVDIGAYEYTSGEPVGTRLSPPKILTGTGLNYVSYGANRHRIIWNAVPYASGYELEYSTDGETWLSLKTAETGVVITGLPYDAAVTYRVRALGGGTYLDSIRGTSKTFHVCPMDINGDGDITSADRILLANCWLSSEGEDDFLFFCDIDGDGDISVPDRNFLSSNWLLSIDDENLAYPSVKQADPFFAEYASPDINVDPNLF